MENNQLESTTSQEKSNTYLTKENQVQGPTDKKDAYVTIVTVLGCFFIILSLLSFGFFTAWLQGKTILNKEILLSFAPFFITSILIIVPSAVIVIKINKRSILEFYFFILVLFLYPVVGLILGTLHTFLN